MEDSSIDVFKEQLSLASIESEMNKHEQIEIPTEHTFSGGVYIRQILIPKGTIIMGKRHRHETCNILLSGELSIFMGEGQPVNRVKGPLLFTSPPLTKKLAYAHEDTIFLNIHPTEETDLEKIEDNFIIPEEEYTKQIEGDSICLGLPQQSEEQH
jgi:hypothetical protein